ncbi:MAG: inositol monophosphatase family protein [Victivallales bacterium]|jgi:myo-inositol-1(or 4)-monophosphatase
MSAEFSKISRHVFEKHLNGHSLVFMKNWNRKEICSLLLESGEVALKHYETSSWKFKSDRSLITAADREIENLLAGHFDRPDDSVYMIGEETVGTKGEEYISSALKETAWIVDPIDGTAPYAHHVPTWGISIGFMQKSTLAEGAVFLPATGEMFITEGEDVLFAKTETVKSRIKVSGFSRLESKKLPFSDGGLISVSQSVAKRGLLDLRNPVQAVCCTVISGVYLVMGRYMAYIASVSLWDIAGILPIVFKSGFRGRLLSGEEITLKVDKHLYKLSKSDSDRWRLKDQMILAPNRRIADRVAGKLDKHGK